MGLDDDIAILAAAPVFGLFDGGALRLLTFAGERTELATGDTLFRQGDRADGGYVVMSGLIELRRASDARDPEPGEAVSAGRSALIGRTALFQPGRRPTDARAREPSEVLRVSAQLMTRVLREFPEAATAIHDWLARDLQELTRGLGQVRARLVGSGQDQ